MGLERLWSGDGTAGAIRGSGDCRRLVSQSGSENDGTVVAWGRDDVGQATVPAGLFGVAAIDAASVHNLALKKDGTVVAWGRDDFGEATIPPGLSGVAAIAAG